LARGGHLGDVMRGAVWGMLPCGMVYSALGVAVIAIDPLPAATVMIAFGVSTMPVLLALGILSKQAITVLQSARTRRFLGVVLLALAAWNIYLIPARIQGASLSFFC
jgi:uncharacterized protein